MINKMELPTNCEINP